MVTYGVDVSIVANQKLVLVPICDITIWTFALIFLILAKIAEDTKDLYLIILDPGLNPVVLGLVYNDPQLIHHASFIICLLIMTASLKYLESDSTFNILTKLPFLAFTT